METKSIMIVGVGGQGSLLASKLLGALLTNEGYDVKVSEVHGMSQRGGSVVMFASVTRSILPLFQKVRQIISFRLKGLRLQDMSIVLKKTEKL